MFSISSLSFKALLSSSYFSCRLKDSSSFAVSMDMFSSTKPLITVSGGSANIMPGAMTSLAITFLTVRFSIRDGLSSPYTSSCRLIQCLMAKNVPEALVGIWTELESDHLVFTFDFQVPYSYVFNKAGFTAKGDGTMTKTYDTILYEDIFCRFILYMCFGPLSTLDADTVIVH